MMRTEEFYQNVCKNKIENNLKELTGDIIKNIEYVALSSIRLASSMEIDDFTLTNRKKISEICIEFHKNARTLTSDVKKAAELLGKKNTIIVESAHQPNLFPYEGTMIKFVLSHLIAEKIRENGHEVVELFGLLDRNDLRDGWTRRTEIPNFESRNGILRLEKKVSSKKMIFNKVPPPSEEEVFKWKNDLVLWVKQNRKAINKLVVGGIEGKVIDSEKEQILFSRIKEFFELSIRLQKTAKNYGEFNSYFLSEVINKYWEYPTLFLPYSSSIHIFNRLIKRIIENGNTYYSLYNKYKDIIKSNIEIEPENEVRSLPPNHIPFWYICSCDFKAELIREDKNLKYKCNNCNKEYSFQIYDIDKHISKISLRNITRHLVFFEGLKPSLYISGWGAMPFTFVGRGIANNFGMHFPIIVPFRIKDKYMGLGHLRAELELKRRGLKQEETNEKINDLKTKIETLKSQKSEELKRKSREIRDLETIKKCLSCRPSILDFWINKGIRETKSYWENIIASYDFY